MARTSRIACPATRLDRPWAPALAGMANEIASCLEQIGIDREPRRQMTPELRALRESVGRLAGEQRRARGRTRRRRREGVGEAHALRAPAGHRSAFAPPDPRRRRCAARTSRRRWPPPRSAVLGAAPDVRSCASVPKSARPTAAARPAVSSQRLVCPRMADSIRWSAEPLSCCSTPFSTPSAARPSSS